MVDQTIFMGSGIALFIYKAMPVPFITLKNLYELCSLMSGNIVQINSPNTEREFSTLCTIVLLIIDLD